MRVCFTCCGQDASRHSGSTTERPTTKLYSNATRTCNDFVCAAGVDDRGDEHDDDADDERDPTTTVRNI